MFFSILWQQNHNQWHIFPRLALVLCFPALGAPVSYFRALGAVVISSRAWHPCHDFPRLAPLSCFPALGTGVMFSRTWRRCHVFLRMGQVACYPMFGACCMFSISLVNCVLSISKWPCVSFLLFLLFYKYDQKIPLSINQRM